MRTIMLQFCGKGFGTTIDLLFLILISSNVCHGAKVNFNNAFEVLKDRCFKNAEYKSGPCSGVKKCGISMYGGACWKETCPGKTREEKCPEIFFFQNVSATAYCSSEGKWNFSLVNFRASCTLLSEAQAREVAKALLNISSEQDEKIEDRVYVIFSWISLSFMVPSLVILFYYIDNNNVRFNLHKNLIVAFLLRVVTFFIDHYGALGETSCNVFWLLNRYFAVSEVTWMMNEALFLLKLLFRAFDAKSYFWSFFAFGWGFPFVLTFGVYLPLMLVVLDEKSRSRCWTEKKESLYMFSLYGPMALMLLINFGTLIYVIYVLLQKLRTSITSELLRLKKGVKAALILMPLLGIIYLMIFLLPEEGPVWVNYLIRILYPMQGTMACLVYVIFNAEVRQALKSRWNRWNNESEFMDRKNEISSWLKGGKSICNERAVDDLGEQTVDLNTIN